MDQQESPDLRTEMLISTEPATGETLWTGAIGDADAEVSAARAAWAGWAARPLTVRVETLRRFANVVRARKDEFADLIARETGKPLWEAGTEVEAVVKKLKGRPFASVKIGRAHV